MEGSSGQAALLCGAGGALGGAAIGAAASRKNPLVGALIGAAIGGLVGATACFAIAEYKSQQVKGYQETKEAVSYQTELGDVVQITNFSLVPSAAAPGSQVTFNATYYVMNPDSDREVTVTETRTLKKLDPGTGQYKELGRPVSSVTMKPGMRSADGKFDVRSGVEQGRYLLAFRVDAGGRSDEQELPFVVTTDQAQLRDATTAQVVAEPVGAKSPGRGASQNQAALPSGTAQPSSGSVPGSAGPLASLGETKVQPPPTAATPPGAQVPPPVSSPPLEKQRIFLASKVKGKGNVRSGPGLSFEIVGQVNKDDRFVILETHTAKPWTWFRIRLEDGRDGWVRNDLGDEVKR